MLSQLVLVSQPNLEDEQFDKTRWTKDLSPFLQLWNRLNQGSDLLKLSPDQMPAPGEQDPPSLPSSRSFFWSDRSLSSCSSKFMLTCPGSVR